ncbi:MAG: hypothetical protein GY811_20575 [Myxococcales bacterium]|nr:hypothetical protein [Myxococcales bacterium]
MRREVTLFGLTLLAVPLVMAGALSSCVEKGPPEPKIDKAYVQANLLSVAPSDLDNVVNVDFDGKIRYLGNRIGTKQLSVGGAGSITHFWEIIEPPGSEWRIFSHLNGTAGQWMNLDATDMRTGHPAKKWKSGEIIRDEQKFTLTETWAGKSATLSVGLYRKGGQSTDSRMPIIAGPKDAEHRSPVFTFSVSGGAKQAKGHPNYAIRKATGPITIDGKADEDSWKNSPMSPNFTDVEGGLKVGGKTVARLLWDDEYLYAFVQAEDRDVYSQFKNKDDTLWKEDVIELFIDADKNRRGYIELQVNPNNAHFDAWFPKGRGQKHHFEWESKMKSAVVVHGTADKRSDRDEGWDVEIAIPLADVRGMDDAMRVTLPPEVGDSWRLNVVRGEKPKDRSLAAATWNPITVSDFHALGRMLTVEFADSEGVTKLARNEGAAAVLEASEDSVAASTGPATEEPAGEDDAELKRRTPGRNDLMQLHRRALKRQTAGAAKTREEILEERARR